MNSKNKTKEYISIKYAKGVVLPPSRFGTLNAEAASISVEMMKLGFIPSEELMTALCHQSLSDLTEFRKTIINALSALKGANVKYVPMYPNFPQQVMEADALELYVNAMLHYWSVGVFSPGHWLPDYKTLPRELMFEHTDFIKIGVITEEQFENIFTKLVTSNDSLSEDDKDTVKWFIDTMNVEIPSNIPFKENMCFVAGTLLERRRDISGFIKTATDILRIATYLSGGDVSLAANTKFKSLPRPLRRKLVSILAEVITEEDIARHRNKWNKLFHNLHVGDYSKRVYNIAKKVRENQKIETFASSVQNAIDRKDFSAATKLLSTRPGEFARRLDHLIRVATKSPLKVVFSFLTVADKVPTRILMQLLGHFATRNDEVKQRVVFPKGSIQRATIVSSVLPKLDYKVTTLLIDGISDKLRARFSKLPKLGKVYVDPDLFACPLPTQQRSASSSMFQVARGTHLPIGEKGTLRFFIYWVGDDLDLSATFHNVQFKMIERVSFYNLRSTSYNACHSGDITSAPKGASEFIDIDIASAIKYGARYVAMNVNVYRGPTFSEHKKCYAGWMTREAPNSNEIYDPKTVQQKIDLTSATIACVPVIFDLVTREAIWVDLPSITTTFYHLNTVDAHRASIEKTLEAIVHLGNKPTLFDLFSLHAQARGTLVNTREDADVIYSLDGGIGPYDILEINSKYMADN